MSPPTNAEAIARVLHYIDTHRGQLTTKPVQLAFLKRLTDKFNFQYLSSNYGRTKHDGKSLYKVLMNVVRFHRRLGPAHGGTGGEGVMALFMEGSQLLDRRYVRTVREGRDVENTTAEMDESDSGEGSSESDEDEGVEEMRDDDSDDEDYVDGVRKGVRSRRRRDSVTGHAMRAKEVVPPVREVHRGHREQPNQAGPPDGSDTEGDIKVAVDGSRPAKPSLQYELTHDAELSNRSNEAMAANCDGAIYDTMNSGAGSTQLRECASSSPGGIESNVYGLSIDGAIAPRTQDDPLRSKRVGKPPRRRKIGDGSAQSTLFASGGQRKRRLSQRPYKDFITDRQNSRPDKWAKITSRHAPSHVLGNVLSGRVERRGESGRTAGDQHTPVGYGEHHTIKGFRRPGVHLPPPASAAVSRRVRQRGIEQARLYEEVLGLSRLIAARTGEFFQSIGRDAEASAALVLDPAPHLREIYREAFQTHDWKSTAYHLQTQRRLPARQFLRCLITTFLSRHILCTAGMLWTSPCSNSPEVCMLRAYAGPLLASAGVDLGEILRAAAVRQLEDQKFVDGVLAPKAENFANDLRLTLSGHLQLLLGQQTGIGVGVEQRRSLNGLSEICQSALMLRGRVEALSCEHVWLRHGSGEMLEAAWMVSEQTDGDRVAFTVFPGLMLVRKNEHGAIERNVFPAIVERH